MTDRTSLPHYSHLAAVPDPLASRRELRRWGLHPGGPAVARVTLTTPVSGAQRPETLSRVAEAVPWSRRRPRCARPGGAAAR